ncbi:MAG: hypothetical protein ACH350_08825 [Parachlamydiaceae bacterium]
MKINLNDPLYTPPTPQFRSKASNNVYLDPQKKLTQLFQHSIIEKLKVKPKVQKKITLLNSTIREIQKKIEISQKKMTKLQGGSIKKLPLIGLLIHFFFHWYNKNLIFVEKMKTDLLIMEEAQYKEKIETLRASFPTEEEENPRFILELDNEIRSLLEEDFPNKDKQQAFYNHVILPVISQAIIKRLMDSTKKDPYQCAAIQAAAKGKAAQAGFSALNHLAHHLPIIKVKKISTHQVFLLPKQGAVFKYSTEQAKEEEAIVNALFDLVSDNATVGSFNIRKGLTSNFGIEISVDERTRGYVPEEISSTLLTKIKGKLSKEALLVLNHRMQSLSPPTPLSFFLSPDLSDPKSETAYLRCEKCQWTYTNATADIIEVDFKTLHRLYLEETPMANIKSVKKSILSPTNSELNQALNVRWKIVSLTVMKLDSGTLSELVNIEVKPFIHDMILMDELNDHARSIVLNRLTPESEFNAIMTGELQLLDMNDKNLGVAPESTPEYKRFKNILFSLPHKKCTFHQLLLHYLKGELLLNTPIEFTEKGKVTQGILQDLPDVNNALQTRWKFVIFDTDRSLNEDNRLQEQTRNRVPGHLIPLRSVLLETDWKDAPLSQKTLNRLLDSKERDLRVVQWIQNKDAPIYKQLSDSAVQSIEEYLDPLIQKYSLSPLRKDEKNEDVTIKGLKKQFINEICDPSIHHVFWKTLEDALSTVTVRKNDTWELIAKRYHQIPHELRELNQRELITGRTIKIKYDLTSSNLDIDKKRRKIAGQLFPRITYRQQRALLERQHNRREYLQNHQQIFNTQLTGKELLTELKKFVTNPTTPLSSIRREEIMNELNMNYLTSIFYDTLPLLKNNICKECQPTYFNLLKAMYPLLADAYALNDQIYQNSATAGRHIGLYWPSLEQSIALAKKKFKAGSSALRLADTLQDHIQTIKDPAFFGHWE